MTMALTQVTTGGVDENINIDSNTLKVDGANNRVGIGTAAPNSLLNISSSADNSSVEPKNDTNGLRITNSSSSTGSYTNICLEPYANDVAYIRAIANGNNNIDLDFGVQYSGQSNATSRMRIDNSGRSLFGLTSAPGTVGGFSQVNIGGTSINANGAIGLYRNTASPSSGQGIGAISFANSDGNRGALIQGLSGGTWGTNDYPGELAFSTTADGASSVTEALRITNQRHLKFSDASADPAGGSNIWQKSGVGLALGGGQLAFYTGTTEKRAWTQQAKFKSEIIAQKLMLHQLLPRLFKLDLLDLLLITQQFANLAQHHSVLDVQMAVDLKSYLLAMK